MSSDDNKIGYRKPPQHSRFQKGKSGNPKGRPKGAKNLKTDLLEELSEQIVVNEGGRTVKISKQRAVVKVLFARTLKGDSRLANTLLNTMIRLVDPRDQNAEKDRPLSEDENAALAVLETRLFGKAHRASGSSDKAASQHTKRKRDKS
jgi:hypothetical protein